MDYLDAIRRESERFYATADGADPTFGVPSCPGWTTADLVWHLGEVHWFWATVIETRASNPEGVEASKPVRPSDYRELVVWGRSQVDHLLSALEATADDVGVWTWALNEADHTVGFIRRHQVQEAALHRWDLQSAATQDPPDPIAPDAASDSIDEMLAILLPWTVRPEKELPGSVHLHCTDTDGEWFVHPDGRVERIHAKGDSALRGAASDLLLALYKRVPLTTVDVVGDESVVREFVTRMSTD